MSIDTTSFSELSPEEVAERKAVLDGLLSEQNPELDYSEGTVNQQLIVQPNSELDAMQRRNIDRWRQSNSLLAIEEDPTLADDGIVDKTLSNFMVTRREGTASGGTALIVTTANIGYIIPTTTAFTSGSRTYFPTARFSIVTNSNLVTLSTDRLIRLRDDGKYWAVVDVEESVEGGAALVEGSPLGMSPEVANLDSAATAADFPQGTTTETNAELLARLEEGTAFQTIADRKAIVATLTSQFSSIVDSSLIGLGDDEAVRDTTHILGINSGGKGDFYLRTTLAPVRTKLTVLGSFTGNSVNRTSGGYTGFFKDYRLPVSVDAVAGFLTTSGVTYYNPSSTALPFNFVEDADVMGFTESLLRGIRTLDEPFSPEILDEAYATYSRYQSGGDVNVVQDIPNADYATIFAQTLTGLDDSEVIPVVIASDEIKNLTVGELKTLISGSGDSLRVYDVNLYTVPDMVEIQDYLNVRDNRPPGADYLAKAPIPCFTSAAFTVRYLTSGATPDAQEVADAAAGAINRHALGSGNLTALEISIAVQAVLPTTAQVILPMVLVGVLRNIDGTVSDLLGTSSLDIPDNPALASSDRTVGYFATADDITVTLDPV